MSVPRTLAVAGLLLNETTGILPVVIVAESLLAMRSAGMRERCS
jgi:hypothetical protein